MREFNLRNRGAWYLASLIAVVCGRVDIESIMIELARIGPLASA